MHNYHYDLHLHSCLSPCGDEDMTPNNIAGMAALAGLQLLALTDHNTCGNCKSFFAACRRHGIVPVPGMELTTAEEIHLVCLFAELSAALAFDAEVRTHLPPIENRPDIFGQQLLLDENDEIIGEETAFLLGATDLALEDAVALVRAYGGVCYPAHVDRTSNGMIAILGDIPPEPGFTAVEFREQAQIEAYKAKYPSLADLFVVCSSDAHYLWKMHEAEHGILLDDEPYSSARVREALIAKLKGADA